MAKNEAEDMASMFLGPTVGQIEPTVQTKTSHVTMTPEEEKIVEAFDKNFPKSKTPQLKENISTKKALVGWFLSTLELGVIIGLITWFWR